MQDYSNLGSHKLEEESRHDVPERTQSILAIRPAHVLIPPHHFDLTSLCLSPPPLFSKDINQPFASTPLTNTPIHPHPKVMSSTSTAAQALEWEQKGRCHAEHEKEQEQARLNKEHEREREREFQVARVITCVIMLLLADIPPPPTNISEDAQPSWLPQISLLTSSHITDAASRMQLTQTFINPPNQTSPIAQAKYNSPLYESCAIVSFRCRIGNRRVLRGAVKDRERVKAHYEAAVVASGETAGLLEQCSPDAFSTTIGNIPAGETVVVEIEYIMELKHDAQADGLRFTIPTSIAPRYGAEPTGLDCSTTEEKGGGMKISVKMSMPSHIRNVQSPSHTISMRLGGHASSSSSINSPDSDTSFDPKLALVTLTQPSTSLSNDFILIVQCSDLSFPRALLETHPTIPSFLCIPLIFFLYMLRNDRALKSSPASAIAFSKQRRTPETCRVAAEQLSNPPLSVADQIPPKTGRCYIVVGEVRDYYYSSFRSFVNLSNQAGFIGGWVVLQLLQDPRNIRVLDIRPPVTI
jgi:hypothetical protein